MEEPVVDSVVEVEELEDESVIKGIHSLTKAFRYRLKRDFDVTVAITGDEGSGKTNLAIQLCMDLDKNFLLKKNVLFDPDLKQLHGLIYNLPKHSGIVVDETIRVAYKRRWQTANNIFLNELYTICRYEQKASFFCIPRFGQLDSDFQKRILFWVHIPERGFAVVFKKEENPFSPDPWNVKESYKLMKEGLGSAGALQTNLTQFLNAARQLPNYVGVIRFPDFQAEIKAEYISLKKPFVIRELVEEKKRESARSKITRVALENCVGELFRRGMSQKELAGLTGYTIERINDFLESLGLRKSDVKARSGRPPTMFLNEGMG